MPHVHCLTSRELDAKSEETFKAAVAAALAELAAKPENYLFVSIDAGKHLFVRGQRSPGAVLQVSLVGTLGKAIKKELSVRFCRICQETMGVPMEAVYIVFNEVPGENWGWSGGTFG